MTVKELIEYLLKCNETLKVETDYSDEITIVIEHNNYTNPDESYIELI